MLIADKFQQNLTEGMERLTYLVRIRENDNSSVVIPSRHALAKPIRRPTSFTAVKPFQAIVYGSTANNRREFAFFHNKLRETGLTYSFDNLADKPRLPLSEKRLEHSNNFLVDLWRNIELLSDQLPKTTLNSLHAEYCQTFLRSFFVFSASLLPSSIRAHIPFALVSNDHAPMPVAFAQACRAFGIPIGYIQHAEINEQFPPLAFDFAILNNSVSAEIYQGIHPELPPVFIVPRFARKPDKMKLGRRLKSSVKVGLFLTSLCDFTRIDELINGLRRNDLIASLDIQPHPRVTQEDLNRLKQSGVSIGKIDLGQIDVAVCQNTSMVIELLHHGIKTIQIFEYDFVTADHYRFVETGLVPRITPKELATPFWRKCQYPPEWGEKYGQYDPSYIGIDETERLATFLQKYMRIVRPTPSTHRGRDTGIEPAQHSNYLSYNEALKRALCSWVTTEPACSIDTIEKRIRDSSGSLHERKKSVFLEKVLQNTITTLYQERNPQIVAWMNHGGKKLDATSLSVWAALFSRFWTNSSLTNDEYEFFFSLKPDRDSASVLDGKESLLCCLVVRRNDACLTSRFLSLFSSIAAMRLDMRARTELGRHLFRNRRAFPNYYRLKSEIAAGQSGLNLLRVEIIGCTRHRIETALKHKEVESQLFRASTPELRRELAELVFPTYEKHRSQLQLMEVFWSKDQRTRFYKLISDAIAEREPFSFVRLSDGEGWIFADGSGPFTPEDEINREIHWWGSSPSVQNRSRIRASALAAISSADILGIPSIYRILQSVGSSTKTLQGNVTYRGLVQVLAAIYRRDTGGFLFTDEKANIPLFQDINTIKEWLNIAQRLVFISSVKAELLEGFLGCETDRHKIDYVEIPTHFRTQSNPHYVRLGYTFPQKYAEIEGLVASMAAPGVVFLNSSGVAGKGLNGIAKANGAIAIDLGGAMDAWVHNQWT